ncbi:MAG: IclR family transcriptional regulator [Desulfosarcinaceae bacterium]|jgi:IclR family KDG regulon transcriptional repressor
MQTNFKRVPALDKSFAILELMARSSAAFSINEIVRKLRLNKSTVFNIMYTLTDLKVLERGGDGLFRLGTRLYLLGSAAAKDSGLIQTVHAYLIDINRRTRLSAFLGIRSGRHAVIVDKVDAAHDIKISSEIGMRLSLFAGASGKALASLLPDEELDRLLETTRLKPYTGHTVTDKSAFKKAVRRTRQEGIARDREEYIAGIVALAVPLNTYRDNLQAAVWIVGLRQQLSEAKIPEVAELLKKVAADIDARLAAAAGPAVTAVAE